ncbi:MAG: efflux RND transporter periplasmic adaptor subunit [Lysobacterales bacterium]
MNARTLAMLLLALLLGAAAGWWLRAPTMVPEASTATPAKEPTERKILYYRNPMGQPDTSPVPKKDSMGMDYVPVYADEVEDSPGTVALSPQRLQTLGVRTQAVERKIAHDQIRASGRIEVDQARRMVIAPKFDGWIERLYANQSGQSLRRGQPLMAVYAPELVSTQNEFLIAQSAARKLPAGDSAEAMQRLADAALLRLRNFDIPPAQVQRLRQGQAERLLTLTAPANAVILEPPMVAGSRFMAGDTVLTLADLSRVWLVAAVPTLNSAEVRIGQAVRFTSAALPGREFTGSISFVDPMLDASMRTLEIRVELDNPDGVLRPALYGDVLIELASDEPQLLVPRSAVLDSGTRQVVFVEVSPGRFEPRPLQLGRRAGEDVVVLDGLRAGEQVVVAANFLIDAESNLRAALQTLQAEPGADAEDPMPAHAGEH